MAVVILTDDFFLMILFAYFWLCCIFVAALWLSLVAESGSYALVVVRRLLIAVVSLVGHRLYGTWASVVVARGLSCSTGCRIFPDPGSSPRLLHWQVHSLPLDH